MNGRMWMAGMVLLAGCSQERADQPRPKANASKQVTANTSDGAKVKAAPPSGNVSLFTIGGLNPCKVIEKNEEEGPFYRHRCPGIGGYNYEVIEHDLRQELLIIGPGGRRDELGLGSIGNGGFSTLGTTFDWRGPAGQPPRVLTVRYNVDEDGDPDIPDRSYLAVIRLRSPACLVASVPPGPDQNDRARAIADRVPLRPCMKN